MKKFEDLSEKIKLASLDHNHINGVIREMLLYDGRLTSRKPLGKSSFLEAKGRMTLK